MYLCTHVAQGVYRHQNDTHIRKTVVAVVHISCCVVYSVKLVHQWTEVDIGRDIHFCRLRRTLKPAILIDHLPKTDRHFWTYKPQFKGLY